MASSAAVAQASPLCLSLLELVAFVATLNRDFDHKIAKGQAQDVENLQRLRILAFASCFSQTVPVLRLQKSSSDAFAPALPA